MSFMNTIREAYSKNKGPGVRKANTWLHTLTGFFLGWIFYLIFFTGTFSFYREEMMLWAWPESHLSTAAEVQDFNSIGSYLDTYAQDSPQWSIMMPSDRSPITKVRYYDEGERPSKHGGHNVTIDSATGEQIDSRDSRLMSKMVQAHYMLFGMGKHLGLTVVGIITMVMFVALISGVIIHRKIFKDFFTFRPKRGQMSWQDMHNVTGVVALPYHFVFIFSGLLLTVFLLNPWGIQGAMEGDEKAFRELNGGKMGLTIPDMPLNPVTRLPVTEGTSAVLNSIHSQWNERQDGKIAMIMFSNPGTPKQQIVIRGERNNDLASGAKAPSWSFNAEGELVKATQPAPPPSSIIAFKNILEQAHQQLYAGPIARAIYFLGGLLGCIMIATGSIMWVQKREKRKRNAAPTKSVLRAKFLNVATIVGLPASMLIAFWANRIIPAGLDMRMNLELFTWYGAWVAMFIHAYYVGSDKAWRQQTQLIVLLSISLAIYNIFIQYPLLGIGSGFTWLQVPLMIKLIDISFIAIAAVALYCLKFMPKKEREVQLEETVNA